MDIDEEKHRLILNLEEHEEKIDLGVFA